MKLIQKFPIGTVLVFLFFNLFQNNSSFSQVSPQLEFVPRSMINLSGEWEVRKKGDNNWQKITLPAHEQDKGVIFFRKSFDIPMSFRDSQFVLNLAGINFSFRVKFNEQYIATQNHGFTALSVPIASNSVHLGNIDQIEIEVNTELSNSGIPIKNALFQPEFLGGIFRDVSVEIVPSFSVFSLRNDISILDNFSQASIVSDVSFKINPDFKSTFLNPSSNQTVFNLTFNVFDVANLDNAVYSSSENLSSVDIERERKQISFILRNPKFWDIKNPNLYVIEVSLSVAEQVIDQYSQKIGLRKFQLQNNRIVLNKDEIIIRGVTFIEDKNNQIEYDSYENILSSIKTLGFNCISWFTPPPEKVLAKMDSLGLLSIIRIPIWNTPSDILSETTTLENGESILQKILLLVQNHSSVLSLSFGQGFDSNENGSYDFIKHLRDKIPSSEDLFITSGFRNYKDIQPDLPLDFITIDLIGKYPDGLSSWLEKWVAENPNLPVLYSDVFVPFVPTVSDTENTSISQSKQALELKTSVTTVLNQPTLGFVLGGLYDWSGVYPSLASPSTPRLRIFQFGISSENKTPRMAWSMIQNLNSGQQDQFSFQEEKDENNKDNLFLFFGLAIIAVFLYSFRKDRKLRGNFIRILTRPFGFHMETKEGRKIAVSSSIIVFLTLIACWALILASLFYYLRLNLLFDFFLAQLSLGFQSNILLINMAWQPFLGFLGFTVIFSLLAIILVAYIRILAVFAGVDLSFRNGFTFVTWEGTIFIFLLPIALVFHRLLAISILHLPILIIIIIFFCWYLYRLFIGMKTIFNFPHWLSFIFIILIPMFVWIILFIILDHNRAFFEHTEYLFNVWKSSF